MIKKATAICQATEASIEKAQKATSASPNQTAVIAFVTTTLIPATQAELAKIHALGEPIGDHGQLAAILADMEKNLNNVLADPANAVGQSNPFAIDDQRLRTYGLPACAT